MIKDAQYKVGDVFFYEKKQLYMIVVDRKYITSVKNGSKSKVKNNTNQVNEWLYDCAYLLENTQFRRYYETRLSCLRLVNNDMEFVNTLKHLYLTSAQKGTGTDGR